MKRVYVLVPTGNDVGLTSISLGMVSALKQKGLRVGFLKPVAQKRTSEDGGPERSTTLARKIFNMDMPAPITLNEAERLLSIGNEQILMEQIVELYQQVAPQQDVVVVEGMVPSPLLFYSKKLNQMIVRALDADVILVAAPHDKPAEDMVDEVEIEANGYAEVNASVAGCVLNKVGRTHPEDGALNTIRHTKTRYFGNTHADAAAQTVVDTFRSVFARCKVPVLAYVPWNERLASPMMRELANHLGAHALRRGDWAMRRVESVAMCAMSISKSLYYFQDGTLVLTTGDRADIILAACMASLNGVKLAGIVLCGRYEPDPNVLILCEKAFAQGLPIFTSGLDCYTISHRIAGYSKELSVDDMEMAESVFSSVSNCVEGNQLDRMLSVEREHRMSPPEFRSALIRAARTLRRRIVLPEGNEPRTVRAAVIAFQRQIAVPVLLGNRDEIQQVASQQGLVLPDGIEIIDPASIAEKYVLPLVELRKSKGLTPEKARELLRDSVWVGTMMLKMGDADGLVSGAVHSTADTVRPALQVIKTQPGVSLISSVFFMCLPTQVLVYGDCAINQEPGAEELAQIAIQSADSAKAFGIPPRVAMISYSTGTSGTGAEVEKVREATEIVRLRRPDLIIDGPLQYDAATTESVARTKAPNSPVAGRATVLVFPDLNTGNTTYKAVQRSANLISIGPMLQGLAKPVNDLSRGALVDDIIYTIALTAIQAGSTQ